MGSSSVSTAEPGSPRDVTPATPTATREREDSTLPITPDWLEKFNENWTPFVIAVRLAAGATLLGIGLAVVILTSASGVGILAGFILMGAGYWLIPDNLDPEDAPAYVRPLEFSDYERYLEGDCIYDEPISPKKPELPDLDTFDWTLESEISAPADQDKARTRLARVRSDLIPVQNRTTLADATQCQHSVPSPANVQKIQQAVQGPTNL